jgi:hypothetical protein
MHHATAFQLPASFHLPPLKGGGSGVEGKAAHYVEVELEGKWKVEAADVEPEGLDWSNASLWFETNVIALGLFRLGRYSHPTIAVSGPVTRPSDHQSISLLAADAIGIDLTQQSAVAVPRGDVWEAHGKIDHRRNGRIRRNPSYWVGPEMTRGRCRHPRLRRFYLEFDLLNPHTAARENVCRITSHRTVSVLR